MTKFRYHIHINCDQHVQTCLLSSYFLRSIFLYTLPHSEHDMDYATLFIDNSAYIWPGLQITSDEFRLNPQSLMDTLAYISEALIRHDICLHVRVKILEFIHYYYIVYFNRFSRLLLFMMFFLCIAETYNTQCKHDCYVYVL